MGTVTVTATTIALGIWCVFTTRFLEVVILLMTPSLVGTITALTRTCKNEHSAFLRISGRWPTYHQTRCWQERRSSEGCGMTESWGAYLGFRAVRADGRRVIR